MLGEEDTSIEKILKNMNYSINHSIMQLGTETSKMIPKGYRHESFVRRPQMRKANNFSPSKLKPRRHLMDPMGYKQDKSTTKMDYREHLANQQKLSVSALQKHIRLNHPKQVSDKSISDGDNWSFFEQIGRGQSNELEIPGVRHP